MTGKVKRKWTRASLVIVSMATAFCLLVFSSHMASDAA
jgi:hypothetical protein